MIIYLEKPVEWHPSNKDVGEEFQNWKSGKDHPVDQPLSVILLVSGFQGFDGIIGGIYESNGIAEQLGSISKQEPGDNTSKNS